jgi:hypothetical protein
MEQTPDTKLIDSMAMRYRHDFGLLDESQKEAIRTTMKQLWEEVVGLGFYKPNKVKSQLGGVEWLEQEIKKLNISVDGATQVSAIRIIETAKQIEKEQKETAKILGHQEGYKRGYLQHALDKK